MEKFVNEVKIMEIALTHPCCWIEARLRWDNWAATHFFYLNGKKLYHEGIDGECAPIEPSEFVRLYRNTYWVLDYIIPELSLLPQYFIKTFSKLKKLS